jgi:hypothetical protein
MNRLSMTVVAGMGAAVAAFAALPAAAATITFDFTTSGGTVSGSGYNLTRTYNNGGVTLVARGLSIADTNAGTQFTAGQLGQWNGYGLGVCNQTEGTDCLSPGHQVDNSGGYDFVFMQLDPAAQITSITVRTYNSSDTDVTYFLGNTSNPLNLVGSTVAQLSGLGFGSATTVSGPSGANATNTVAVNSAGTFNSLLIGARFQVGAYTNDGFKIRSVVVDYTPPPPGTSVPEPMALALFGLGLLGLGVAVRRRTA